MTEGTDNTVQLAQRLQAHLQFLYPQADHEQLVQRILDLVHGASQQMHVTPGPRFSQDDLMLITYGNSICHPDTHPLHSLYTFLSTHVRDAVSLVHILPFFPFSTDDGFSVVDYRAVNPDLGDWEDVRDISHEFDLMFDLVINHVSRGSRWFLAYLLGQEPYDSYFLEADQDPALDQVVRPRTSSLLTDVETVHGQRRVWTTFSPDQVDLNFGNPDVLVEFVDILLMYLQHGARYIRLDAIAFLWKEIGTNCIHLPQTHRVVKLLRDVAEAVYPSSVILTETNVPNKENLSYFGDADEAHMVYQFSLAPLILHALYTGTSEYLNQWAHALPTLPEDCTYLNFSASHDGIGLRPAEGILPPRELQVMIDGMRRQGGHVSMRRGPDGQPHPYEMNITYFDATGETIRGRDEWHVQRFLCSQAIVLAMRGVPAVYIHSLTATPNDHNNVGVTGRIRSINRRHWQVSELIELLNDKRSSTSQVFTALTRLMRVRRQHNVFHPTQATQTILDLGNDVFAFARELDDARHAAICLFNLTGDTVELDLSNLALAGRAEVWFDLVLNEYYPLQKEPVRLAPYQFVWLVVFQ